MIIPSGTGKLDGEEPCPGFCMAGSSLLGLLGPAPPLVSRGVGVQSGMLCTLAPLPSQQGGGVGVQSGLLCTLGALPSQQGRDTDVG